MTASPGGGTRGRISSLEGIPALSLDAISSVAYGPEAMLVVLATAGAGALARIEPLTVAIVVLLAILVLSYRQVIEAYPDGGGSYAVSQANLGAAAARAAAAALIVDYILTVAVSIAAGVAALVSAFPGLDADRLPLALAILACLTGLNLRGIATSARALLPPAAVFIAGIYTVIVAGLIRSRPAAGAGLHPVALHPATLSRAGATVGVLVLLKAFSVGSSALTGVEAIANDVPAFRPPSVRRAMRTEVMLGVILATMLLGLAFLTVRFRIAPSPAQTVLSQVIAASIGRGPAYFVVEMSTTVILALAANTSFGGFPMLVSLLARDNLVPHVFGLRADRPVFRYGVTVLAVLAGALLVATRADTNALIPLYAIGVFTGFTLSQTGMVRHWLRARTRRWRARAALNGTGAVLTAAATVIFLVTKFTAGAWAVTIAIPALLLLFDRIARYYADVAGELEFGRVPGVPVPARGLAVVTVAGVSRMTQAALAAALSLGGDVLAVSVQFEAEQAEDLCRTWARWDPGVRLVILRPPVHSIAAPVQEFLASPQIRAYPLVLVLIPEVEPRKWRHRVLHNQRDLILARVLRRHSDVIVARLPFRLSRD